MLKCGTLASEFLSVNEDMAVFCNFNSHNNRNIIIIINNNNNNNKSWQTLTYENKFYCAIPM